MVDPEITWDAQFASFMHPAHLHHSHACHIATYITIPASIYEKIITLFFHLFTLSRFPLAFTSRFHPNVCSPFEAWMSSHFDFGCAVTLVPHEHTQHNTFGLLLGCAWYESCSANSSTTLNSTYQIFVLDETSTVASQPITDGRGLCFQSECKQNWWKCSNVTEFKKMLSNRKWVSGNR